MPNRVDVGKSVVRDVLLTVPTGAMTASFVLADTQVVTGIFRDQDYGGILQSVTVVDADDQGAAFDIYILDSNVVMGTENQTPSISDANATAILPGMPIAIATTDYKDLGGVKVAGVAALGRPIKPVAGTTSLAIAAVNGAGTPTYSSGIIQVRLGLLLD